MIDDVNNYNRITIQPYHPKYTIQLINIFKTAIEAIDPKIYSQAEKKAWLGMTTILIQRAINKDTIHKWQQRFTQTQPLVAIQDEGRNKGQAVGFIEIIANQNQHQHYAPNQAYIDCLYIHPDYQGQGMAQMLYDQALATVLKDTVDKGNIKKVWVHASKLAYPFFIKQGFSTIQTQQVQRQGVALMRYLMQKEL